MELSNELKVNGKLLSLSTSEDGTKLLGKILICPLDEANLNKKGIKEVDLTDDELKTLVGQPLVGKVVKNSDDSYDFTGHNLKKYYEYNPETNSIEVKYTFDTVPIGFFTSSEIEDIDIEGTIKRCIVANVVIWCRYERVIKVIFDRFNSGTLSVSWELNYGEKYEDNGIEWLKDIVFIGVAVLGNSTQGAYPDAHFMEVSETNEILDDKELVASLTEDIIDEIILQENAELNTSSQIEGEDININKPQGGKLNMAEVNKTNKEISALTDNDIYRKVRDAINATDMEKWYYVSYIFPYEYKAIAYTWDSEDTDFVEFVYTVNSDETVSITSQKAVKMQFMPISDIQAQLAEKDTKIAEIEAKLTIVETDLSTKVEAITKLAEEMATKDTTISEKDTLIAELTPFKAEAEKVLAEKAETELSEKREALKAYATKGGYISVEELETSEEIKKAISEVNTMEIKSIIAERVIAKLDEVKPIVETSEVETSTTKTPEVKVNLNSSIEKEDPLNAMKSFLND